MRFGDGEMMIIDGTETDLSHKFGGEHTYTPGDDTPRATNAPLLAQSLTWQADHYFVGIACPCCVGEANFFNLKQPIGTGRGASHLGQSVRQQ